MPPVVNVYTWWSEFTVTLTGINVLEILTNCIGSCPFRRLRAADHIRALHNVRHQRSNPSLFCVLYYEGHFFLPPLVQESLKVRSWSSHCLPVIMIGGRVSLRPCSEEIVAKQDECARARETSRGSDKEVRCKEVKTRSTPTVTPV